MIYYYRIVDICCDEMIANGIDDPVIAQETLLLLQNNYPEHELEIQQYPNYTVRGLGRDPDLH